MKKSVLSVLLILALSIAFIGCGGEDENFPSNFPADLITALEAMGIDSFTAPEGAVFDDFEYRAVDSNQTIDIVWKNANEDLFDAFFELWGVSRSVVAETDNFVVVTGKFSSLGYANLSFYDEGEGGALGDDLVIEDGSIVFFGSVNSLN